MRNKTNVLQQYMKELQLIKKCNGNIVRTPEEKAQMIDEATVYYGQFLTAVLLAAVVFALSVW